MTEQEKPYMDSLSYEKVQALFFDMDGTLVDSIPALKQAYQVFARKIGFETSLEEFEAFNGLTAAAIAKKLAAKIGANSALVELQFFQAMKEYYPGATTLFRGAREFLQFFHRCGRPLFLVTSASRSLALDRVQRLEIAPYFEAIIAAEDVVFGKPHPEPYQKAVQMAGIEPGKGLAFEDALHGIASASQAGLPVVAMGKWTDVPEGAIAQCQQWADVNKWLGIPFENSYE